MKKKLETKVDLILLPGELYIAQKPLWIKTILGSCISVILHSPRQKVTAISHAQLPYERSLFKCVDSCPIKCNAETSDQNRFKYVTCSTRYMLEKLFAMGIKANEIKVKLIGGANVLSFKGMQKSIGIQNVETAHHLIDEFKLTLIKADTGGKRGRTIYLDTRANQIWVRKHTRLNPFEKSQAIDPFSDPDQNKSKLEQL